MRYINAGFIHSFKILRHDYYKETFKLDVATIDWGVGERNWDVRGSPIKELPIGQFRYFKIHQ